MPALPLSLAEIRFRAWAEISETSAHLPLAGNALIAVITDEMSDVCNTRFAEIFRNAIFGLASTKRIFFGSLMTPIVMRIVTLHYLLTLRKLLPSAYRGAGRPIT